MAQRAGISSRQLRDIEAGRIALPRLTTVGLLADALELEGEQRDRFCAAARPENPVAGTVPAAGPVSPPGTGPESVLARPAQLPGSVAGFVGRGIELKRLDQLLPSPGPSARDVAICAVSGTAGVGKTALALHWAHGARASFPDGQLYVNLHGYHGSDALSPATALRGFLTGLGVPGDRIPADLEARIDLYRSLVADRRMLIVLDNARDADHVRPLLPGAPDCRVMVTSRDQLQDLVAIEGAEPIPVSLLDADDARDLIARRIGADRAAAYPEAVDEIVALSAGLPLALAVVTARAATYPAFPLAAIATELRDATDQLEGFPAVRAVLSWSYRTLTPGAARLFRLCGAHPEPDLAAAVVGALTGEPPTRARRLLAELTRAHLLAEHTPGRYAMHDLLRAYSVELLIETEEEADRDAATRRMLDHYLGIACTAALLIEPHRDPITPLTADPTAVPLELADRDQAFAWFTAEHPVLLAAVARAESAGLDRHVWQLAWSLVDFLDHQGHWWDWITVEHAALRAADRLGDERGAAYADRLLGRGYAQLSRYDEALRHYQRAIEGYDRLGDLLGQAHSAFGLSWLSELRGNPLESQEHRLRAADLYRRAGHRVGLARVLNALGWGYAQLGDYPAALRHCGEALELNQQLDDAYGQAAIWDSIGFAHHHLGDHVEAVACLERSLRLYREAGDLFNEADVLVHLGDAHEGAGDRTAARAAWQRAVEVFDQLGRGEADALRARIAALAPPGR
ncbi:tetratricopeptide (TPR) repeat protein [Allocatelliglobosispora scoriae]|uniref:Tetratricopeptide (TPR) repeat protein n=1 Tax=Allocatelliglobosispora scoriae TaxID=643052 RepID=A0A841BWX3_9ACTN|nr:tetratricopeptide (TPR) repeat protein [Allocatelliglobosispora scoriae]